MRPEFESLPPGLPYLLNPRPSITPLRDTLTLRGLHAVYGAKTLVTAQPRGRRLDYLDDTFVTKASQVGQINSSFT